MSIPVGPAGVIGVKRTLARGMSAGLASGLGIALADLLFAVIALAGISSVAEFLQHNAALIQLVGAVVITLVGLQGFRKGPTNSIDTADTSSIAVMRDISSMFVITLFNPQTVIGFTTLFAAMVAFYSVETSGELAAMVGGIFLGSLAMWVLLSFSLSHWRGNMADTLIAKLHHYASALVVIVGLGLAIHALVLGEALNLG